MKKPFGAKKVSMPAGVGIGVGVATVLSLAGAALLAWLIGSEKMNENAMGMGSLILLALSSAIGSIIANICIREKKLIVTAATSATFFILLLAITALLFEGQYHHVGATALSILAGGMIAIIPGIILSASGGKRIKIKAFR